MLTEWQKRHQREYETVVILDPRVSRDQAERVVARVSEVMTAREGQLVKVDYWGKRKLAYRLRGNDWGFYYYLRYLGVGGLVAELERNFRMLDPVMRFQTIVLRDDLDGTGTVVPGADVEFHLDLLAKEALEPVHETAEPGAPAAPADAAAAPAAAPAPAPAPAEGGGTPAPAEAPAAAPAEGAAKQEVPAGGGEPPAEGGK